MEPSISPVPHVEAQGDAVQRDHHEVLQMPPGAPLTDFAPWPFLARSSSGNPAAHPGSGDRSAALEPCLPPDRPPSLTSTQVPPQHPTRFSTFLAQPIPGPHSPYHFRSSTTHPCPSSHLTPVININHSGSCRVRILSGVGPTTCVSAMSITWVIPPTIHLSTHPPPAEINTTPSSNLEYRDHVHRHTPGFVPPAPPSRLRTLLRPVDQSCVPALGPFVLGHDRPATTRQGPQYAYIRPLGAVHTQVGHNT